MKRRYHAPPLITLATAVTSWVLLSPPTPVRRRKLSTATSAVRPGKTSRSIVSWAAEGEEGEKGGGREGDVELESALRGGEGEPLAAPQQLVDDADSQIEGSPYAQLP